MPFDTLCASVVARTAVEKSPATGPARTSLGNRDHLRFAQDDHVRDCCVMMIAATDTKAGETVTLCAPVMPVNSNILPSYSVFSR